MDEASEQCWAGWVAHQFMQAGIAATASQHQATVRSLMRLESQLASAGPQDLRSEGSLAPQGAANAS